MRLDISSGLLLERLRSEACPCAPWRCLQQVDWRRASALVVGSEAVGLSAAVRAAVETGAMQSVGIPTAPGASAVESLNAAVAGSVILCEALRQRSSPHGG